MELVICQTCGVILRTRGSSCPGCGTIQSQFSATALPAMTQAGAPLAVTVKPDPLLLERVVSKRQVTALLERPENGNGHGNGHDNGYGNGHGQDQSIDYGQGNTGPGQAQPGQATAPPGLMGTPWVNSPQLASNAAFATPQETSSPALVETKQTDFAPQNLVSQPAPDAVPPVPAPQSSVSNFFAAAASPTQPATTTPAPEPAPAPAPAVAPAPASLPAPDAVSHSASFSNSTMAAAGGFAAGAAAATAMSWMSKMAASATPPPAPQVAPTDPNAPPSSSGPAPSSGPPPTMPPSAASAPKLETPPQPQANQFFAASSPSNPAAAAPAAPAESQAAAAEATNTTGHDVMDFFARAFNEPSQKNEEEPKQQAAPGGSSEYELSDRSDFFASPAKNSSDETAPVEPNRKRIGDDFTIGGKGDTPLTDLPPGVSRSTESSSPSQGPPGSDSPNSATGSGLDFFTSSSFKTRPSSSSASSRRTDDDEVSLEREKPKKKKNDSEIFNDFEETMPRVAPPQGRQSKTELKESDSDDDEEDNSSRSSGHHSTVAPARRSFTDSSARKKEPPKKGKPAQGKESKEDSDDEDDKASAGALSFLEQEVGFLGLRVSRQTQLFLIGLSLFIGFVMFQSASTLMANLSGTGGASGQPSQQQQPPSVATLSGDWTVHTKSQGKILKGLMRVQVQNGKIVGQGKDGNGVYQLEGTISGDRVQFTKEYVGRDENGAAKLGKPIFFDAKLLLASGYAPYMSGIWHCERSRGISWRRQTYKLSDQFEATMTTVSPVSPQQQQPASEAPATAPAPPSNRPMVQEGSPVILPGIGNLDEMPMSQKFGIVAICLIVFGIAALLFSLTIFGPGGKMNIWEKQKYIPSQFRAMHRKMVSELSKGLKPGGLPLGRRCEWHPLKPWQTKNLALPPSLRKIEPHMLVLGAGDKGKSRLIAHMMAHDIESNDRAVVLIDSDGSLVALITKWIAAHPKGKELAKRVVLLDPTWKNGSLGYNPLEMPEDGDLQSAASSIVYGFKAIYTEPPGSQSQWNQQTANILRNCALLLMSNGKTLTDLPTLLNDNDFRDVLLESVEKRKHERSEFITLLDTWGQYKRLARTDQWITWVEPILNRVSPMLGDARIRTILTKPVGDIKMREMIMEKKILLVKVAKGQLDQNANLLGSLIVTGVKQAALSLSNEASPRQNPVSLYLDEFDNFVEKDTIEAITHETDKFQIGFIGCAKTVQHLPEDFRNQLVLKVNTLCCFALAKKDGDLLGPQMFRVDGRKIKHQTIQNFFNKVNTSPQFELISDEEKLNIDRVVGQESRTFYAYRVGTTAGVFHMKTHDFPDPPEKDVNQKLIDKMHGMKVPDKAKPTKESKESKDTSNTAA